MCMRAAVTTIMRTTKVFYCPILIYNLIVALLIVVDQYSKPVGFVGSVYILILLGMYLLFLLPLRWQIFPALFLSTALIWIFLTYKEPVYELEIVYGISTIALINVFGIIASFTKGRYRRTSFLHLQQEKNTKEKLQDALDKIKHLFGILPISSNCLMIRDEKGQWRRPDVYIHEHSQTEISHGIYPDCVKRFCPDQA